MSNILKARQDTSAMDVEVPDHIKKFKTHQTIPTLFRQVLPPALAVSEDKTVADQVVNASYERQKKIEQKRATENAIQKVANINMEQD